MSEIYDDDLRGSIFSRRILFYSLFLVFYDFIYQLPKSPSSKQCIRIKKDSFPALRDALNQLNSEYENEESSLKEFITASTKSTADKRERTTRHKLIYERLKSAIR